MLPVVWITGVNGFTGGHLVRFLESLKDPVRIVGLDCCHKRPLLKLHSFFKLDLNDLDSVAEIAIEDPPSYVFHLAALLPPADERDMWRANVGGTLGLLRGLYKAGCRNTRLVCVGSASEYLASDTGLLTEKSPCGGVTLYGRTKWAQTMLALCLGRELGLDVIIARPFNLVGPGLPRTLVAGELCAQFASPAVREIKVGNIRSERDFIDVRDAVAAYWALAHKGKAGEIYNVCSGVPTSIERLISLLCEITGRSPVVRIQSNRTRSVDVDRVYGSREKIYQLTGWQPEIDLKQSLMNMLGAMKA